LSVRASNFPKIASGLPSMNFLNMYLLSDFDLRGRRINRKLHPTDRPGANERAEVGAQKRWGSRLPISIASSGALSPPIKLVRAELAFPVRPHVHPVAAALAAFGAPSND
jgi:hypothetical protein